MLIVTGASVVLNFSDSHFAEANSGYVTFGHFKPTVRKVTVRCEEKLLSSALINKELYSFCPDFFSRNVTNRII